MNNFFGGSEIVTFRFVLLYLSYYYLVIAVELLRHIFPNKKAFSIICILPECIMP